MEKKVPARTCIACRRQRDKFDLVRIVRASDGSVSMDPSNKAAGRGTYVCNELKCLDKALDKRLLGQKLRCDVSDEDMTRLKADFEALMKDKVPSIIDEE